jgi:hypothetical protein
VHKSKWNQCVHKTCLMMMGCVEENDTKTTCPSQLDDDTVCPRDQRFVHGRLVT